MTDQPSLFDLPPTRLEDVTLEDWDIKHHALARQLYAEATPARQAAWWAGLMEKRLKNPLNGTPE